MQRSSVALLGPRGISQHPTDNALPNNIGAKARGLLSIPRGWVPPFFVISPEIFSTYRSCAPDSRRHFLETLRLQFDAAVDLAGLSPGGSLILRSNAAKETIDERGRYPSLVCARSLAIDTLDQLYQQVSSIEPSCEFGVVVQRLVQSLTKGHLSNARRVAEEYRDGLIEIENSSGHILGKRIAYRQWRQSKPPTDGPLLCRLEGDIANSLRPVLAFAARARKRVHFEWVWDGMFIHVVQADETEDRTAGTTPESPLRGRYHEAVSADALFCFQPVYASSAANTGKLRNHALYKEHGFWQPVFYQLTDARLLQDMVDGKVSSSIRHDLEILTKRPLVIRTSSAGERSPLLPRSHQLTTTEQAVNWLIGDFSARIRDRTQDLSSMSLLAHHYIPARVAAFSMAHPDRTEVQIQSLWGIPEGLYYYPHDSFTVQTIGIDPKAITPSDYSRFRIANGIRFKSHFVAPNGDGLFVRYDLAAPWDWKPTISDRTTLAKIATFSRVLALEEQQSVNIMWFVDCRTSGGAIDAVPWYHEILQPFSEDVFYQRNSRDEEVVIATEDNLAALETRASQNQTCKGGARLVLRLSPAEDRAIRNEEFATRVGKAGKKLDAIVLLNGATLSHIYYVLHRTGVHLSSQNPSEISIKPEIHGKLVRDKIPATVAATGEVARVATLSKEEIVAALRLKLVEEALEVKDASRDEIASELADVMEVVRALAKATRIGAAEIERLRKKKAERRGAFDDGLVLLATGGESSISDKETFPIPVEDVKTTSRVVQGPIPALEIVRMGAADTRDTPDFFEHVQDATVPLTHAEWLIESPEQVSLPKGSLADTVSWSISGRRVGTNLRLKIKLRMGTNQLELPLSFDD